MASLLGRLCGTPPRLESREPIPNCVFCNASAENGFKIVLETPRLIAFHDRSPAASTHVLVIPREHIRSVKALNEGDIPLVKEMEYLGRGILKDLGYGADFQRLGFHIPPFYSVDHLHMHVLGLPFKSTMYGLKYTPAEAPSSHTEYAKGWRWFVDVAQVYKILERGAQVKVGAC